jgi:hypothetical protein
MNGGNMPNASQQMDEEPPVNRAIEDVLAIAGGDEKDEETLLRMMMHMCAERLARVSGRSRCREMLQGLDHFVRDAQPSRPWRD